MRRPLPADISSRLTGIRPTPDGYLARCPAHDDKTPSLLVSVADDDKVLLYCYAGCDQMAVLDALQATPQMLNPNREERRGEWTPRGDAIAVYSYNDATGKLLFQVCRTADKQFPQRRPDTTKKSGWNWSLGDVPRVLYRLPEVTAAVADGLIVYVVEGEKDAHAIVNAGACGTCSPGGAGKWRDAYAETLRDANVIVVADRDEPGQAHARTVAASLRKVGATVVTVEAAAGKDAADHLSAGKTLDEFLITSQEREPEPDLADDLWDFLDRADAGFDWVIPGLIERTDRIMITGFEGIAKSSLLRQIAVAAAAGLDPFTGEMIEPARVLMVDCENSDRQTRRAFRWIAPIAGDVYGRPVPRQSLFPILKPGGLDLARDDDAEWLMERVTSHRQDLLVIGPVYRLLAEDPSTEVAIRQIAQALDKVRLAGNCALLMEAHAGHGNGLGKRSTRPLGSSYWMRWVDAGIGLSPAEGAEQFTPLSVTYWKPARDRESRRWPHHIRHGVRDFSTQNPAEWPWVPVADMEELALLTKRTAS